MNAKDVVVQYTMPLQGYLRHPTLPIYEFQIFLRCDPHLLLVKHASFVGTVEEVREVARVTRELFLIKKGISDG